jgi:hypothetical protein
MLVFSQRHVSNPLKGSSFQIIIFIGLTASREEKAFPITVYEYISPSLASVGARGFRVPIGNCEVPLAASCKSPGRARNGVKVAELLSFRHKSYWH